MYLFLAFRHVVSTPIYTSQLFMIMVRWFMVLFLSKSISFYGSFVLKVLYLQLKLILHSQVPCLFWLLAYLYYIVWKSQVCGIDKENSFFRIFCYSKYFQFVLKNIKFLGVIFSHGNFGTCLFVYPVLLD